MSNTNKAKSSQLGMAFGTANGKLRKQLLFKYVKMAEDHYCYVCNEEIESVDDFTIEHKQPWFNRDADLFWDLENIAFSHSWCNVPHENGAIKLRKIAPEGMAWCSKHQGFAPIENFGPRPQRWNGLKDWCRSCDASQKREARSKK